MKLSKDRLSPIRELWAKKSANTLESHLNFWTSQIGVNLRPKDRIREVTWNAQNACERGIYHAMEYAFFSKCPKIDSFSVFNWSRVFFSKCPIFHHHPFTLSFHYGVFFFELFFRNYIIPKLYHLPNRDFRNDLFPKNCCEMVFCRMAYF